MAEAEYATARRGFYDGEVQMPPGQVQAAVEGITEKAELIGERITKLQMRLSTVLRQSEPEPRDSELTAVRREHSQLAERLFGLDESLASSAALLATLCARIDV
jgi:hypothetical protein